MSVLDEAKNLVNDKFETKSAEVFQEFRVLVRVASSSNDPAVVRALLDNVHKHFDGYIYADGTGSVQVIQAEPK